MSLMTLDALSLLLFGLNVGYFFVLFMCFLSGFVCFLHIWGICLPLCALNVHGGIFLVIKNSEYQKRT